MASPTVPQELERAHIITVDSDETPLALCFEAQSDLYDFVSHSIRIYVISLMSLTHYFRPCPP